MDLVDEEDVALLQVGEDPGEVAGFFNLRAGGDVEFAAGGAGDDVGESGLAEAGRAGEQDVVEHVAAAGGGLDHQEQAVLDLLLADEFGEDGRAQRDVEGRGRGGGGFLVEVLAHPAGRRKKTMAEVG